MHQYYPNQHDDDIPIGFLRLALVMPSPVLHDRVAHWFHVDKVMHSQLGYLLHRVGHWVHVDKVTHGQLGSIYRPIDPFQLAPFWSVDILQGEHQ